MYHNTCNLILIEQVDVFWCLQVKKIIFLLCSEKLAILMLDYPLLFALFFAEIVIFGPFRSVHT